MRISKARLAQQVGLAALFLVVAYLFGQLTSYLALKRPIPGAAIPLYVCALLGFFCIFAKVGRRRFYAPKILGLAAVAFMMISVVLQKKLMVDAIDFNGASAREFSAYAAYLCLIWALVGAAFSLIVIKKSSVVAGALLAGILYLVLSDLSGGFVVDYSSFSDQGARVSHLNTGPMLVILLCLVQALIADRFRMVPYFVGMTILFLAGGRADVLGWALALPTVWTLREQYSTTFLLVLVALGASAIFGPALMLAANRDSQLARMLFIGGIEDDQSAMGRVEYFLDSLKLLPAQAPYGDISIVVKQYGVIGAYMHNIVSVWQFYGVIAFLCTVLGMVFCAKFMFTVMRSARDEPTAMDGMFSCMLIFSIVTTLTAKSFMLPPLWMALGYWAVSRISAKESRR